MKKIDKIIKNMKINASNIKFDALKLVCDYYFGTGRSSGGSHIVYKTNWLGDPRINIQKGKNNNAKSYQVKQVLKAIERIKHD